MPTNERAIKGEKNKKTTDDVISGKEKARDRREESLAPKQSEPGKSSSNRNEPKAGKQHSGANDNKDKGGEKPKKKNEEKKSKR